MSNTATTTDQVHFNFEDSMATDEHGLYYVGPAVCNAIGSYATHVEADVTCPGCLDGIAIIHTSA